MSLLSKLRSLFLSLTAAARRLTSRRRSGRPWFPRDPFPEDREFEPASVTYRIPGRTPSDEAKTLVLQGRALKALTTDKLAFNGEPDLVALPKGLKVRDLIIENCAHFRELPMGLLAENVVVRGCGSFAGVPRDIRTTSLTIQSCPSLVQLPEGFQVDRVVLEDCPNLRELPPRFRCVELRFPGSRLERLAGAPRVGDMLNLEGSQDLRSIPSMTTHGLILRGCSRLETLPDELEAAELDLSGCVSLRWPQFALMDVRSLDISDCAQIGRLPEWLTVTKSIDVAGTGLSGLPPWLAGVDLRWRGVKIDERIAFAPETITCEEIVRERNAERRRVMLERTGWERFLRGVDHEVVHADTDPGGERRLLRFSFGDEEDLLVLAVSCPSTARRYFIRVPPHVRNCHAAAAWIAGFDDPNEYRPVAET